jgi:hypothetical protein
MLITMRYEARFDLSVDDHLALRRYLIEQRGVGREQLRAAWRRIVVINATLGVLVGVWFTAGYGTQLGAGGPVGYALVFVLATTLFWAVSGTMLWVVRFALGGPRAERERALRSMRQRIEHDEDAAPRGPYAVVLDQTGVREQLRDDERLVPWRDVEDARAWNGYVMIDTADGLAIAVRQDAIGSRDEVAAFVDGVIEWAG